CFFCLFLFLSFLHIHAVFHGSNKAAVKKPYPKHPSLLFKFAKICMVGVKENIVNCTILLTPKSNFFCLVYLDFSVCFVVKQPTRVVVHKTAFES
uniref:Secreted protein n=1 Tax=Serinus canaria TaxID=9135 RepID=A0A8C9MX77_SERCA